jgi:CRP-like cAMP-binding protein
MRIRRRRDPRVERLFEQLSGTPLLDSVAPSALRRLAEEGRKRRFNEGETIVQEGNVGFAFFILLDGAASVSVDGEIVRGLGAGDAFGELALLRDRPRSATVVAATDASCLLLSPWHFGGFLRAYPDVAQRLTGLAPLYRQ